MGERVSKLRPEQDELTKARLLAPADVRRSLQVGAANDPAEREADRIADLVLSATAAPAVDGGSTRIRRAVATVSSDRGPLGSVTEPSRIRRAAAVVGAEGGSLDETTGSRIRRAATGGSTLDPVAGDRLTRALDADLSRVRLHAGTESTRLNEQMQARAFTMGRDIFFRDGIPDAGTASGMHLLAHEVAHTVQQGTGGTARRVVRRALIPKAADAFNAAVAANGAFAVGQKDTDDLAATSDQEELARVHGRNYRGGDNADQQKVAQFVRAVVLTEYSSRLRSLETATDKDSGQPLSATQKVGKRAVYKKKADEFRKKHTPLVEKGSDAPETQSFLTEHGFAGAFSATGRMKVVPQTARIDVRSTFIGGPILGMRIRAHLFIVYTSKDGKQFYFRGGPDEYGYTTADHGEYTPDTVDWDPSAPSVTVAEGADAERRLDSLIEATNVIDGMQVPYRATVSKEYGGDNPNAVQDLVNTLGMATSNDGENCNATAWTILTRVGIAPKKPSGKHPGWGSILGSKTAGKENALPAPEGTNTPEEYVVDSSHEVADRLGMVQVFRDRSFYEPLFKIASGTKVQSLAKARFGRRISVNGDVGYVKRSENDYIFDWLPTWTQQLRTEFGGNLDNMAENLDATIFQEIDQKTSIPPDLIEWVLGKSVSKKGDLHTMMELRFESLGRARLAELVNNPEEIANLAAAMHADAKDVAKAAADFVGNVEAEEKVPALLLKYFNGKPIAANLAVNQAPGYEVLEKMAADLGKDLAWIFPLVDALRPDANQGHFLERLLYDDATAVSELPDVNEATQRTWAAQVGITLTDVKNRCQAIHQKREDARKAKAKAARLAKQKKQAKKKKAKPKAQGGQGGNVV